MENVNDKDGSLTHQSEVEKNDLEIEKNDLDMEKNDSIANSNTEAPTPVQENTGIEDPMVVEDKMKEEIVKNKETSEEDGKISEKKMATMGDDSNEVAKVEKELNSSGKSDRKLANGSGMIFMCNSKTKKDCYRYKILGLPMSKKDTVSKVSKGMRLFLFDCDLKLMYGIYKAASEGGDNIEPKAFKSAYPSQVRFSIVQDCLPLAEEKFKAAIKDNYYSKNKFDCQLSPEQVKKLCKLFKSSTKGSRAKRLRGGDARADASHRSGKYTESERRGRGSRGMRFRERDWEEEAPRLYREDPRLYERGGYPAPEVPLAHHRVPAPLPSVLPPLAQHQRPLVYAAPPPPMAYNAYDRPLAMDPYSAGYLDHGQRGDAGLESGRGDPYSSGLYREPLVHHGPAYPTAAEAHHRLYYRY